MKPVGRGHNLCLVCPSPDSRSPPAVFHLPGGQGVLLLLCPVGPLPFSLSEQDAWVLRGTGSVGGKLKTERPGAGAVWNIQYSEPKMELPEVGKLEGGGRAGPLPLSGGLLSWQHPFLHTMGSPPQPPAWMKPTAPSLAISLRDLATVTMATQSSATGPNEKGRGPRLGQGCL